jgi:hypothetical protein
LPTSSATHVRGAFPSLQSMAHRRQVHFVRCDIAHEGNLAALLIDAHGSPGRLAVRPYSTNRKRPGSEP